jgi:hypothetical protein
MPCLKKLIIKGELKRGEASLHNNYFPLPYEGRGIKGVGF